MKIENMVLDIICLVIVSNINHLKKSQTSNA